MVTNSQGDKGYYVDKTTGQRCTPNTDGTYDMNKCRFDTVIRGTAAGGFGQKIHTRAQEKGLPDSQHVMWKHYDILNKCDTNDINECNDNFYCTLNLLQIILASYYNSILMSTFLTRCKVETFKDHSQTKTFCSSSPCK